MLKLICHKRTKRIKLNCHFVREKVTQGFVKLLSIQSQSQLAEIFTKPLPSPILCALLSKMVVKDLHNPS